MSRVLLVGKGEPDRGGIPTFLQTLRSGPLADEHQITFLNVAHAGTPEGGEPTWGNVRRTLQDSYAIWRAARDHDIVHIHSALAPAVTVLRAGLMAAAGRARGRSVIVHAHGGNIETWLLRASARLVMRAAMLPAHRVVAVWSNGERALVSCLGRARVSLIDNGVDTDRFRTDRTDPPAEPGRSATPRRATEVTGSAPPSGARCRVLYVGLLTARKGVLDLIEASRLLRAEGIDHELQLLGGTPDEGPAAAVPVLDAAKGRATLLGTRSPDQMPAAYADADVFCLPSWWEAMPLSILEAMASGLPVVASDVGDVGRAVDDGRTGHVVPVKSPALLAQALRPLLVDAERRTAMGKAGRARVELHFSSRVTARAVSELFAQVEAGRG